MFSLLCYIGVLNCETKQTLPSLIYFFQNILSQQQKSYKTARYYAEVYETFLSNVTYVALQKEWLQALLLF